MLRLKSRLVLASMLALIVGLAASTGSWSQAPTVSLDPDKVTFFENSVRPVFAESCVTCHMDGNAGGGLRLDKAVTAEQATSIINRIQGIGGNRMPQGAAPLKADKLKALIAWQNKGYP